MAFRGIRGATVVAADDRDLILDRPADDLEPELEQARKEIGDLAESEEEAG